jgi:trans-2,3-dihydro-3-hydroxyanthranilate isomerase
MSTQRPYYLLDVFADAPLQGNPLAVVLAADDLDPARMQAIAREFNLSETVFVLAPESPRHRARLRIFTPGAELAFAGHPTLGAAALLALLDDRPSPDSAFGLELNAGTVPCVIEVEGPDRATGRFRAPVRPQLDGAPASNEALAAALGLSVGEIGLGLHTPARAHSGGSIYQTVPLVSLDALARARAVGGAFNAAFGSDLCWLYATAGDEDRADWRARMFAPQVGVPEDPATGSGAVAFAAALDAHEPGGEGVSNVVIVQGVEMDRPSRIALQMVNLDGRLDHVEIGGRAVLVGKGVLHV